MSTFNQVFRIFSIMLAITGLQHLVAPELCWTLRFVPSSAPKGSDQWLLTTRIIGCILIAMSMSFFQMPSEGILAAGIASFASGFWHKSIGLNPGTAMCTTITAVGALAVLSKYFPTVTRLIGFPAKPAMLHTIQSMSHKAMQGLAWIFLATGAQRMIAPSLNWSIFYPAGTPSGSEYWYFTVRCLGALAIALSAKMMGCPNPGVLVTAATGILFNCWYHNNISINPPMALSLTGLGIGLYGLISRTSFAARAASPSRAHRNMPIPGRVQ
jgi:spore maturation protein SpmB